MNLKYNLIKMIIGVGNVAFILYHSLSFDSSKGYRLWNIVFGILLMFMVNKSVTFTKKQEGIWIFLISAIALTPFNIRLAAIAANLYLIESFSFAAELNFIGSLSYCLQKRIMNLSARGIISSFRFRSEGISIWIVLIR